MRTNRGDYGSEPADAALRQILVRRVPTHVAVGRREAETAGLTRRDLEKLQSDEWQRVARGLRVSRPAAEVDLIELAAAAVRLSGDRAIASHLTAAQLHGITAASGLPGTWEGRPSDGALHVTVSSANGVRYPEGVQVHRCPVSASDVMTLRGVRVTTPVRTLADLLLTQRRILAVAAVEQALHLELITEAQLRSLPKLIRCRPGARLGHQWLRLVTPGTESALETLSRLRLRDSGLRPSRIQPVITAPDGTFVARCDFEFRRGNKRVLGEADGLAVHDRPESRYADRLREDRLRRLGYQLVRWVWSDVTNDLDTLVARIRAWL